MDRDEHDALDEHTGLAVSGTRLETMMTAPALVGWQDEALGLRRHVGCLPINGVPRRVNFTLEIHFDVANNSHLLLDLHMPVKLRPSRKEAPKHMYLVLPAEQLSMTWSATNSSTVAVNPVTRSCLEPDSPILHVAFALARTPVVVMPHLRRKLQRPVVGAPSGLLDCLRSLTQTTHLDVYLADDLDSQACLAALAGRVRLSTLATPELDLSATYGHGVDGGVDLWEDYPCEAPRDRGNLAMSDWNPLAPPPAYEEVVAAGAGAVKVEDGYLADGYSPDGRKGKKEERNSPEGRIVWCVESSGEREKGRMRTFTDRGGGGAGTAAAATAYGAEEEADAADAAAGYGVDEEADAAAAALDSNADGTTDAGAAAAPMPESHSHSHPLAPNRPRKRKASKALSDISSRSRNSEDGHVLDDNRETRVEVAAAAAAAFAIADTSAPLPVFSPELVLSPTQVNTTTEDSDTSSSAPDLNTTGTKAGGAAAAAAEPVAMTAARTWLMPPPPPSHQPSGSPPRATGSDSISAHAHAHARAGVVAAVEEGEEEEEEGGDDEARKEEEETYIQALTALLLRAWSVDPNAHEGFLCAPLLRLGELGRARDALAFEAVRGEVVVGLVGRGAAAYIGNSSGGGRIRGSDRAGDRVSSVANEGARAGATIQDHSIEGDDGGDGGNGGNKDDGGKAIQERKEDKTTQARQAVQDLRTWICAHVHAHADTVAQVFEALVGVWVTVEGASGASRAVVVGGEVQHVEIVGRRKAQVAEMVNGQIGLARAKCLAMALVLGVE